MKKYFLMIIAVAFIMTSIIPVGANAATNKSKTMEPGEHLVKFAKQYVGSKYVRGGKHLKDLNKKGDINRLDCTGFVQAIYKKHSNIKLPGGSLKRMLRKCKKIGTKVGKGWNGVSKAKPGDILISHPGSWRQHVGMYYGKKNGKHMVIECSRGAGGVTIHKLKQRPSYVMRIDDQIKKKSKLYNDYLDKQEKKAQKAAKKKAVKDNIDTDKTNQNESNNIE